MVILPDQQDSRSKHLLRLVLAIVVVLVGVTNGITTVANDIAKTTTAESDLTHDTALRYHAETRELSDHDSAREEKEEEVAEAEEEAEAGEEQHSVPFTEHTLALDL
ncbi:hypothetical protein JG688_00017609 [Phytophthora aleatoria]|uniref:Uncharacterized protein n=1 Tax=Phytophthora aleatoria TaxID=2496075 RepID=A0A8J5I2X9_9STRA|nr:hypothetical protein JG688_00017609 [Phytophthora aleatoria]